MRILIVEDTAYLADAIAHVLKRSRYQVDVASDGVTGLNYARSGVYDVIVLDNMLPRMSGVEVAHRLRSEKVATPIIILSAKGEAEDKVDGLDAGADDYLAKPFKMDELLARIRALTRRHDQSADHIVTVGDLTLDRDKSTISSTVSTENLTAKELALLEQLMTNSGSILSKEILFLRVWGQDQAYDDKYIEVYASYIRRKLRTVGAHVSIRAVRGLGYRLIGEEA